MSTQEKVVPIDDHAAYYRANLDFCDWLRRRFENNEISAITVRGVDVDGEPIQFDIVPINADTVRFVMIGMLSEAASQLVAGHEPC